MGWACHAPRQPQQNHLLGHLSGREGGGEGAKGGGDAVAGRANGGWMDNVKEWTLPLSLSPSPSSMP